MSNFDGQLRDVIRRLVEHMEADTSAEEFSQRLEYSYLTGVYLAVNAIRDSRLVVEGPDCTYMKAQYVQGNHDIFSTLTSVSGYHRIVNTALHPAMMTDSREVPIRELLTKVASHPSTAGAFISSMPMAFITGADYERLCRAVREETGTEVINVRGLSLQGDWLDGYAETLRSLAKQLALPEVETHPRKVAVVGHMMDRTEYDQVANIAEITDMLEALDLEVVSIWLSGQGFEDLSRVAEAGTILSLPYARKAAKVLARRTGADVVDLPLPFGLKACEAWMTPLGERFGEEAKARAYTEARLGSIIPRLEWLIPFVLQNNRVGWVGDPHLFPGFADIMELVGGQVAYGVITNRPSHTRGITDLVERYGLHVHPHQKTFVRELAKHLLEGDLNLLVTNDFGLRIPTHGIAFYDFGFPTVFRHELHDRPFLGFRGFAAFVSDVANRIRQREVDDTRLAQLLALLESS